jgi:predicted O-linked N-acetylglucosamine transferase (SPINDLY family)
MSLKITGVSDAQLIHNVNILMSKNKFKEAIELLNQITAKNKNDRNVLDDMLAICYKSTGFFEDMLMSKKIYIDMYSRNIRDKKMMLRVNANFVSVITYLMQYYINNSLYNEAINVSLDALNYYADSSIIIYNIGHLYKTIGQYDNAVKFLNRALELDNKSIDAYIELIRAYTDTSQHSMAIETAKKGIRVLGKNPILYNELGVAFTTSNQFNIATQYLEKAKNACTDDKFMCKIYINFGHMCTKKGDFDTGLKHYETAMKYDPTNMTPVQNYAMDSLYTPNIDYKEIIKRHLMAGNIVTQHHKIKDLNIDTNYNHLQTRIGFISGDFFGIHPMTFFLKALLTEYDPEKFVFYGYCTENIEDTKIYNQYMQWRHIKYLNTIDTIKMITADQIDILFDLSGHTSGNKLDIFSNRVAKYQISYLGYPCMTGMPNIDYYLIDETFDFKWGKILTMPHCFTHYTPPFIHPTLIQPFENNKYITFGTFNKPTKLNQAVVDLWDDVLDAYPNARLVIKYNDTFKFRNQNRVVLISLTPKIEDYISQYNCIDIALDTFPYAGTTTTCESLLMGTPVITLAERKTKSVHQNTTASLLINSNLKYLVAENKEQFMNIVKDVVERVMTDHNYKQTIRNAFLTGYVTNSKQYVYDFQDCMINLMKQSK